MKGFSSEDKMMNMIIIIIANGRKMLLEKEYEALLFFNIYSCTPKTSPSILSSQHLRISYSFLHRC